MAVWAKILTSLRDHPKALEAGPQAMWLYVSMILYSKERDTHGYFPASSLSTQCHGRTPSRFAQRLVDVGLVTKVDGGYQIVKYDEKQGAGASISEVRDKKATQKRKERAAKPADVASDTPQPVAALEQSRAEQSRKESASALSPAREADRIIDLIAKEHPKPIKNHGAVRQAAEERAFAGDTAETIGAILAAWKVTDRWQPVRFAPKPEDFLLKPEYRRPPEGVGTETTAEEWAALRKQYERPAAA